MRVTSCYRLLNTHADQRRSRMLAGMVRVVFIQGARSRGLKSCPPNTAGT